MVENYLSFQNDRPCPLCRCAEKSVLSHRMQFGLDCTTVICKNCGFCFVSPPPTRDAYAAFYREAYSSYYKKIHPVTAADLPLRENPPEKSRLDLIESYKPLKGARVLEIGPGRGRFLQLVVKRGAVGCAVEPSKDFRKSLEQAGIKVIGDFLESTSSEQKYDLIMLFQVLEHFHDPVDAVRRIKKLLAPGGVVVLDVPNIWKPFRNLDRYFLRYVHLSYFSPQTLKRLFVQQDFYALHVDEGKVSVVVPNQLFAIFHLAPSAANEIDTYRDDWHRLEAHLQRYRKIYPFLHAPVFHARNLLWIMRRKLAKSPVGDVYRNMNAWRRGRRSG